jgi:hypothetical protein
MPQKAATGEVYPEVIATEAKSAYIRCIWIEQWRNPAVSVQTEAKSPCISGWQGDLDG